MTLTDRLSATFLGALALILGGFSIALYLLASVALNRSIDDRLAAALATLEVLAEDEPGGLDWERDQRTIPLGQDSGHDQVRWRVLDQDGREVDRSKNLGEPSVLLESGPRRVDRKGEPWRVASVRLESHRSPSTAPAGSRRSRSLVLSAGLPLEPLDRPLRSLALILPSLSTILWGLTALAGRRLCRTALAPLTRMASSARGLGVDDPARRLPVAATGDELQELALAFNGLLDRWHEALERQSRFAGDASHQLRTPLTALIGQVDVALRRDRPSEEYRRTLAGVREQSDRLRKIVESLLYLARADADAEVPALEVFDLGEWAGDRVRRRLDEAGETCFDWAGGPGHPVLVRAHPVLLAEVLDNLLDNARDHGRGDASTVVRVDRVEGWAALEVRDQGRGIAPDGLSKVFEPFYRAAEARRSVPGGSGLGLAVALRVARSFGGRIEVESSPGKGSRFTLVLPEFAREPIDASPAFAADLLPTID